MKTRTLILSTALLSFITLAFINNPMDSSLASYTIETDSIKPKIDQRTGKVLFGGDILGIKPLPKKQNLTYMVRGFTNQGFYRPITKQKLSKAQLISDLIENYPSSWIAAYNSIEISGTLNGKEIVATSPNITLTQKQKQVLSQAPVILINVHYQKKNDDNRIQNRQMNVSLVVTPEIQAEFIGGYEQMIRYFKNNSLDKIESKNFALLPQPSISFIINENGYTENIVLDNSSKDTEIDEILLQLVKAMPKWSPAKNTNGKTVKQKFVLDIGQDGC